MEEKNKKNWKLFTLILVIIVILIVLTFVAYKLYKNDGKPTNKSTNNKTTETTTVASQNDSGEEEYKTVDELIAAGYTKYEEQTTYPFKKLDVSSILKKETPVKEVEEIYFSMNENDEGNGKYLFKLENRTIYLYKRIRDSSTDKIIKEEKQKEIINNVKYMYVGTAYCDGESASFIAVTNDLVIHKYDVTYDFDTTEKNGEHIKISVKKYSFDDFNGELYEFSYANTCCATEYHYYKNSSNTYKKIDSSFSVSVNEELAYFDTATETKVLTDGTLIEKNAETDLKVKYVITGTVIDETGYITSNNKIYEENDSPRSIEAIYVKDGMYVTVYGNNIVDMTELNYKTLSTNFDELIKYNQSKE